MNEVATTQKGNQIQILRDDLQKLAPQIKSVLPPHISTDAFIRVVMTAVQLTPGLLSVDKKTIFSSCLQCAKDGLLPDGREAALVVYKTKNGGQVAQYLPMVGGVLKRLRNTGEISSISANAVYEKDEFDLELGDNDRFVHRPNLRVDDRGQMVLVYAIAKMKDGSVYRDFMTRGDVERRKAVSAAKNGPWNDWPEEMAKKTVIKRLCKIMPTSPEVSDMLREDDAKEFTPPPGGDSQQAGEPAAPRRGRPAKAKEEQGEPVPFEEVPPSWEQATGSVDSPDSGTQDISTDSGLRMEDF